MDNYHVNLTKDDRKSKLLIHCIQEHNKLYPDCKQEKSFEKTGK